MSRSNRGAAQVSLMWVISFAVIALGSVFFAYAITAAVDWLLSTRTPST